MKFENVYSSLHRSMANSSAHIIYFAKLYPGYAGYGRDRDIQKGIHILFSLGRAPRIYILNLRPPNAGWMKVNTYGSSKGNFRDNASTYLGGFGLLLGNNTAFFAEIIAVIVVVELDIYEGWTSLWLKSEE